MPLYFAYGSNMDVAAMTRRCPMARRLGRARLARHRFFIMDNGYASILRDGGAEVHGLLFDLAFSDIGPLDRYEETGAGLYRKITQPVFRASGGSVRALVYVGCSAREGRAAPGYLETAAAAARAADLPPAYVAFLESLAAVSPRRT